MTRRHVSRCGGVRFPYWYQDKVSIMFKLSDMDYVRGAIANALAEDMTLTDLWKCAAHANSAEDFDKAVNLLAQMK